MILHFLNSGPAAGPVLVGLRNRGAASIVIPATQCGDITFDQIRTSDRTGNGNQLLTWTTPGPGIHNDPGTSGQIAFDSSGNFFWCYAANLWARVGPGGYSNSF
jgi:hypothetical protein